MHASKPSSAFLVGLVVYQIYPRSFQDSNNDGIGDLPGIISRLDYLADLGIGAIWLSPIYPSPMVDFGYDVADYLNVDPLFGTLHDLDHLIQEAEKRHIRIILDLVVNHTSDQHPWFKESSSSRDNPKRDWYIWRDGRGDQPPNNWLSEFGGSAWQLNPKTNQYYLHSFANQQPDLNWQNPEVHDAVKDIMRFWLDRGVRGFRMDAVNWYAKDPAFRDEPPNPDYNPKTDKPHDALLHRYSMNLPKVFDYLQELTDVLEAYDDRIMLIEAHFDMLLDVRSYFDFYRQIDARVAAPFNFLDFYLPWDAQSFRTYIDAFQTGLRPSDTPVYTTGNHDRSRLATRIGPGAAKTAAVLFLTLPGATTIYYGEEIGMEDTVLSAQDIHDIYEKNVPKRGQGRDPERTPMQWSADQYAGFSSHQPWLPIGKNYHIINVAAESVDPTSHLNLYKRLLKLRATSDVIKQGNYQPLTQCHPDIFGFTREFGGDKLAIIANFSRTHPRPCPTNGKLVLSTHGQPAPSDPFQPLEARIIAL